MDVHTDIDTDTHMLKVIHYTQTYRDNTTTQHNYMHTEKNIANVHYTAMAQI